MSSLSTLGLRSSRLTSHSFRIGRATTFAIEGLSDDEIKRIGRWESNTYLRYIHSSLNIFAYFRKGGGGSCVFLQTPWQMSNCYLSLQVAQPMYGSLGLPSLKGHFLRQSSVHE